MFQLKIDHSDGEESLLNILGPDDVGDEDLPSLTALSISRQIQRQPDETDEAEATVYRDAWRDVEPEIDRINDRVQILEDGDAVFGGRFRDWQIDGATASVLLDGAKIDAVGAVVSGGNDIYQPQPDSDIIVNEILSRVPMISAGTIETVDGAVAFSESNASPGKSVTKLATQTGAETRWTPDFELDYVGRLGSVRSETLSPAEGTVLGEPRIQEQTTEEVTHILVLGAQQGTAQTRVERVRDNYDGGRVVQRKYTDKDLVRREEAAAVADRLLEEYDGSPEYLEVDVELPASLEPSLGDEFPVELPEYGISAQLRIMELSRIIDEAGDRFRALFSNRKLSREMSGQAQARQVSELSEGNAGQIVRDSISVGFDPVDDGESLSFDLRYPDNVIDEYEAVLQIESQAYRSRVSGRGHSHKVEIPEHIHQVVLNAHSHDVEIDTSTEASDVDLSAFTQSTRRSTESFSGTGSARTFTSYSVGDETFGVFVSATFTNNESESITINAGSSAGGQSIPGTYNLDLEPDESSTFTAYWSGDYDGDTVDVNATLVSGPSDTTVHAETAFYQIPQHFHDVEEGTTSADGGGLTATTEGGGGTTETTDEVIAFDPGINTFDDEEASDVSVSIGGETVISGLDHPIDEVVDIRGILNAGANQIEATSDTLGELRLSVTYEALKNAGTNDN